MNGVHEMSIASIKSEVLLPEKELVISKSFVLRQETALIASITEQDGIVKLWIIRQIPRTPPINTEIILWK